MASIVCRQAVPSAASKGKLAVGATLRGHRCRQQHTASSNADRLSTDGESSNYGSSSSSSTSNTGPQSSAAAHLLARARIEEADFSPSSTISTRAFELQRKDVPWTGEESIEDAVLRMLVDKYKPLRVPGHKRKIQEPSTEPIVAKYTPVTPQLSEEEQANRIKDQSHPEYKWMPGDPPRYPWEITFRGPTNAEGVPAIKSGVITQAPSISSTGRVPKGEVAARVFRARDASLDYRTGSPESAKARIAAGSKGGKGGGHGSKHRSTAEGYRPAPTSVKAWNSVIEERIELARQQGIFRNLKGHGKPMERDPNDNNPYVERSEFLMNRIVKRQEAAPPFVELQQEMREVQNAFRLRLRQAWLRRATRMLSLQPLTPSIIAQSGDYRDPEWEARERPYHDISVKNMNDVIRKYNVVAPPSARAPVTSVELELAACYKECASLLKAELEKRAIEGPGAVRITSASRGSTSGPKGRTEAEQDAVRETMLSAFRRFVKDTFGSSQKA